ncbi:MAG: thiamine pyrophosphate-binding protein [Chloroflexi bacterium]|nr:MAG: thiamine pyrophosphate-binding protein [Chloroflexota bacterium]
MAETEKHETEAQEPVFSSLDFEPELYAHDFGRKSPGGTKEIHEIGFRDASVLTLDVDQYVADFNERVIGAYNRGVGPVELPADVGVARSLVPPGTGALRDFSYIAPEIPEFIAEKCVGCMTCVTECPDTAILGKAIPESRLEAEISKIGDPEEQGRIRANWVRTRKYYDVPARKGREGAMFGIFIDPTKCKGCAECVQVCADLGYHALKMIPKESDTLPRYRESFNFFRSVGPTPKEYISEKALADMMLAEANALLYVGGAGSCMGCGEATAIRMLLAATGFVYGPENFAIVAATGCNTVYGSTYPYNPFLVPWTNSLFENAPADAMGVRARWNQMGWQDKKLWVLGGDGAMYDIGFQSLSRMLASGMDINVMVLDTQVYSNTGGQASTASYTGQDAKMASFGREVPGKQELRKEIGLIAMMHPNCFVAQTTAAHINHFYKAVMRANEFKGPALINVYTTCQPEHGVADDLSAAHAKLAVESRAFPLFIYDPEAGDTIRERLSLVGNPAQKEDWYTPPRSDKPITFIDFARAEARFAKHFDRDGNPSEVLLRAQADRLANWHRLQELAGLR